MNDTFDGARIHQAELDREIDTLRTERLIGSTSRRPGLVSRARARIGRGFISLGTSLVGKAEQATTRTSSAGTTSHA